MVIFGFLGIAAELDEDQWELEWGEEKASPRLWVSSWPSFPYLMNTVANIRADPHAVSLNRIRASLAEMKKNII